jgi:alpha-tubulin suppressor-like RCC1 family protein
MWEIEVQRALALPTNYVPPQLMKLVYGWGRNVYGQLGNGSVTLARDQNVSSPVLVGGGGQARFSKLQLASNHAMFLSYGKHYAWGQNRYGGFGNGHYATYSTPYPNPQEIGPGSNWIATTGGTSLCIGLKAGNTLWQWGNTNPYSNVPVQLGVATNWWKINMGGYHTMVIKTDGTLWTWGNNQWGQLGLGVAGGHYSVPVQVGVLTNWWLGACGYKHSLAIKTDGTLWSCGYNNAGQLGLGDFVHRSVFTQIGARNDWVFVTASMQSFFSGGITADGKLWMWGDNGAGQCAQNNLNPGGALSSPMQVGTNTNWKKLGCIDTSAMGLTTDGKIYTWGNNAGNLSGCLGLGFSGGLYSSPIQVGTKSNWADILCQYYTMFAATGAVAPYTIFVWGYNRGGQLGQGNTGTSGNHLLYSVSSPVQLGAARNWVTAAGGGSHTLLIDKAHRLFACGYNTQGQLGTGNTTNYSSPVQVGGGTNWTQLAGGFQHSLALTRVVAAGGAALYGWGSNNFGQLGQNDIVSRSSPVQIGSGTNWVAISAGFQSTFALDNAGTLWVCGRNLYGELGLGTSGTGPSVLTQSGSTANWKQVSVGGGGAYSFAAAVSKTGKLYTTGFNGSGQLGQGDVTNRSNWTQVGARVDWVAVYAHATSVLAVTLDGNVWSWGRNYAGSLGLGDTTARSSPVQVGNTRWSNVAVGNTGQGANVGDYSLAIHSEGTLWAWGRNTFGSLGLGDTANRLSPIQVGKAANWTKIIKGGGHIIGFRQY